MDRVVIIGSRQGLADALAKAPPPRRTYLAERIGSILTGEDGPDITTERITAC